MKCLKGNVLDGIQKMLDDRMASRLKPKAVAVEVSTMAEKPKEGEEPEVELAAAEPEQDGMGKLTPEEQTELMRLYEKLTG